MDMSSEQVLRPIAWIRSGFPQKFGIPRQSGLVESLRGEVVFLPEYRDPEAFRGLEEFSHLWLIWQFSQARREKWSPTVRPPRLGGNVRKGVFATRSPFRPNSLGLSSVQLLEVRLHTPEGPVVVVGGADLLDGTPIYDVKPYLPYTDSHPEAAGGFALQEKEGSLLVDFPQDLLERLPPEHREAALALLAQDPRPGYQDAPERVYGLAFAGWELGFRVAGERLTVVRVDRSPEPGGPGSLKNERRGDPCPLRGLPGGKP